MPKIKIEKTSKLAPNDAFGKIKEFFANDRDLRKLDASLQSSFDDSKQSGAVKGSKFEATFGVQPDGAGCRIVVEVNLPLMLAPFKSFVEKTLSEKMGALIG